jgi:hypothetical protein
MMELDWGDSRENKGIWVTSVIGLRVFSGATNRPPATLIARRQEYLPWLRRSVASGPGTDAAAIDSSAIRRRYEMIFERVGPSCYLSVPFAASAEQSASASRSADELPAEDMHRAVSNISQVHDEICETAERIVASSPRELRHGRHEMANKKPME